MAPATFIFRGGAGAMAVSRTRGALTRRRPAKASTSCLLRPERRSRPQLDTWEASLAGGTADPNALFVYWAGSNDLFEWSGINLTLQERIDGVKANLTTAMQRLDAGGAQRILVGTRTPRDLLDNANDQRGQALNAELRALIPLLDATYGARIELFDAGGAMQTQLRPAALAQ